MDGAPGIDGVRTAFIEKMGVVAQGESLPRISGQILALLVFDGRAVSFGELAEDLHVSRASISTSVRLLEERRLIKRISRTGERQDFFQLAENAYASMLSGTRQRVGRARDDIEDTIASVPEDAPELLARLREYSSFYQAVDDALAGAISRISAPRA